jgi:hypothetical protein
VGAITVARLNSIGLGAGVGWAHAGVVKAIAANAKIMQMVFNNKVTNLLLFILTPSFYNVFESLLSKKMDSGKKLQ